MSDLHIYNDWINDETYQNLIGEEKETFSKKYADQAWTMIDHYSLNSNSDCLEFETRKKTRLNRQSTYISKNLRCILSSMYYFSDIFGGIKKIRICCGADGKPINNIPINTTSNGSVKTCNIVVNNNYNIIIKTRKNG